MTDKDIIAKYLGVPYKHQGRSIEGTDCYGLVIMIFADLGIKVFDIEEDYTEDWSWQGKALSLENCYKQWESVDKPRYLDVALFKNGKGVINHAGVMIDRNRFIQTCKAGTVISKVSDYLKKGRLVGYYRNKALKCS